MIPSHFLSYYTTTFSKPISVQAPVYRAPEIIFGASPCILLLFLSTSSSCYWYLVCWLPSRWTLYEDCSLQGCWAFWPLAPDLKYDWTFSSISLCSISTVFNIQRSTHLWRGILFVSSCIVILVSFHSSRISLNTCSLFHPPFLLRTQTFPTS